MWTPIKAVVRGCRWALRRDLRRGLELAKRVIRPIPIVNSVCRVGYRRARSLKRHLPALRTVAVRCVRHPVGRRLMAMAFPDGGPRALSHAIHLRAWFEGYRPTPELLARFRARRWPAEAPRFSILMPVYNVREDWLRQAVASVIDQTYPHWELICVDDGSTAGHVRPTLDELAARDPRVRVLHAGSNRGVSAATNRALADATGTYACFMDHDDALEPQMLHRFAEAILDDAPDLLYGDEVVTGDDLDDVRGVSARCRFSYDYYLSHPYIVHPIAVRADLLRRVGGLDEAMTISQDVDAVLRLLEVCATVGYVPDVLYRWRTHRGSLGHARVEEVRGMTEAALRRHLGRIGADATIREVSFNFRDVQFRSPGPARVAILIPTKDQAALLRACVESLERTVDPGLAEIVAIDHESRQPEARAYLAELGRRHRVVPYSGPFNFSAIMNHGVASARGSCTHYLFLNNDTEAIEPGWLEHMLNFGLRRDVGVVGAALLYADDRVQHAGVVVGLCRHAEHAYKFWSFRDWSGRRAAGRDGGLLANRDYSAVTAACLLIRAEVFDEVGGFDESLAVGFNDTDLCLRVRSRGYKVIQDNQAVLRHHESRTRGIEDPHPVDSARFLDRYRALIFGGDPFYSPLLSTETTAADLRPNARSATRLRAIMGPVGLPIPDTAPWVARADGPGPAPTFHPIGKATLARRGA